MALAFGGRIENTEPVHGKVSRVNVHHRSPIFATIPRNFDAARYHSLVVDRSSLPDELRVDATTSDGTVMALSHRERKLYGVQFHPESVLTPHGLAIIENFLGVRA
jgi:anthranilate/para-aminobenzoate synthase component II